MGFGDYVWDEEDGLGKPPVFSSSMFFRHKTHSEPRLLEADVVSVDEQVIKDATPTRATEKKINDKNTFEQDVKDLYASIDKWRVMTASAESDHEKMLDEILEKPAPRPTPAPRSSPPQARPRLKLSPPPKGRKISPAPRRKIPTLITSNYCSSSEDDESSSGADNERDTSGSDSTATDGTFSGNELVYPSSPTFSPKPFSPSVTQSITPISSPVASPVITPIKRNRRIIGAAAGWKKQDASQPRVATTPTAEFMEKYAKMFSNTRKNIAEQENSAVCYDTAL